mmetsp:Transcript_2540/g.5903  ORF Transcript_2540/g.5903 Transcript_2540/m.5903 type:complete len:216 (-) Transcript_2540:492-1139(-)
MTWSSCTARCCAGNILASLRVFPRSWRRSSQHCCKSTPITGLLSISCWRRSLYKRSSSRHLPTPIRIRGPALRVICCRQFSCLKMPLILLDVFRGQGMTEIPHEPPLGSITWAAEISPAEPLLTPPVLLRETMANLVQTLWTGNWPQGKTASQLVQSARMPARRIHANSVLSLVQWEQADKTSILQPLIDRSTDNTRHRQGVCQCRAPGLQVSTV